MNVTALRQAVKRFTGSEEVHTACLDEMEMNLSVISRDVNTGNGRQNASHLVDRGRETRASSPVFAAGTKILGSVPVVGSTLIASSESGN